MSVGKRKRYLEHVWRLSIKMAAYAVKHKPPENC